MSHIAWIEKHILERILPIIPFYPISEVSDDWKQKTLSCHEKSISRIIERNVPDDDLEDCISATLAQFLPVAEYYNYNLCDYEYDDEYYADKLVTETRCLIQACIYEVMKRFDIPLVYRNGNKYRGAVMRNGKWSRKLSKNYENEPFFMKGLPYDLKSPQSVDIRIIKRSLTKMGIPLIMPHPRHRSLFEEQNIHLGYIVACPYPREFTVTINDILINELHRLKISGYERRFNKACDVIYELYGIIKLNTIPFTREFIERSMKMQVPANVDIFEFIENNIPWYNFVRASSRYINYDVTIPARNYREDYRLWANKHIFPAMNRFGLNLPHFYTDSPLEYLYKWRHLDYAQRNLDIIKSHNLPDNIIKDIVTRVCTEHQDKDTRTSDVIYLIILAIMWEFDLTPAHNYVEGQVYWNNGIYATMKDGYFYLNTNYESHNRLTHLGLPLIYADSH